MLPAQALSLIRLCCSSRDSAQSLGSSRSPDARIVKKNDFMIGCDRPFVTAGSQPSILELKYCRKRGNRPCFAETTIGIADSFGLNKLCRDRFVCVIAHSHLSPILLIAVPLPTNHLRLERHWTSHRQDDAEFCLPAHHVSVSFGGFHERIFFDHWADACHFRKMQRVLGIGWDPSQPALDLPGAENQLARRHFDGI